MYYILVLFSRTVPDFVKFNDVSRTWKINLLFSRRHGNPANSIVSFHHHLKTHPFSLAYPSQVFTASNDLLMNFVEVH